MYIFDFNIKVQFLKCALLAMTQPPPQKTKYEISFGAFGIPEKIFSVLKGVIANPDGCGEDSFCIADTKRRLVLGVADGVGGSSCNGGNPAAFARSLMHHVSEIAKREPKKFKCHKVLKEAFQRILNEKDEQLANGASSTACVVSISKKTGILIRIKSNLVELKSVKF